MQRLITCVICENIFNHQSRHPMVLLCCGNTTCRSCLQKMCQDDAQQEIFECHLCKTDKFAGAKVNEQLKDFILHYWEENPFQITCETHIGEPVSHFCERDRVMICDKCLKQSHITHYDDCKSYDSNQLKTFLESAIPKLTDLKERIEVTVETCLGILGTERHLTIPQFMKLSKEIKELSDMEDKLV